MANYESNNWPLVELDKVLERIRKPVDVMEDQKYQEIGIRSHSKGVFYKEPKTGAEIGSKRVYWIEPNCFIVNIVFAWEQAIAKTTANEQGMIASHRFPMYKPKKELLDLDYLLYFFMMPRGKYLLELASPGGAGRNKTLGQAAFLELKIPVPPIEEQRNIVEILGTWDEALGQTERLIGLEEQRKKGLMQRLLTGQVRFPEFSGEWKKTKVGKASNVRAGGTPNTRKPEYWENGTVRWMKSGEVNLKMVHEVENRITDLGLQNSSAKMIPINSVLIALAGQGKTRGTVAINKVVLCTNQSIAAIMPNESILDYNFLFYNLDFRYEELRRLSTGSGGRGGLNLKIIKSISIDFPSLEEQRRITAVLQTCDEKISLLRQKHAALQQQKKGLMQRLLTGQLRVPLQP